MTDLDPALVEKAAKAMNARVPSISFGTDVARAVLEAVADDLRADAWNEGYSHGIDQHRPGQIITGRRANPYRERADQISPKEEQ